MVKGQMKIQQMAFMIVAVFFFFILVGLFFLRIQFAGINQSIADLQEEQAISSLSVIANMPELNCDSRESLCLDKDKLRIMSGESGDQYNSFWPTASIKVHILRPNQKELVNCPAPGCNYFEIFNNNQENTEEFSTYVSVCEKIKETGYVYENCETAKLVVGRKINEK